jgi:uncharacterized protein YceK
MAAADMGTQLRRIGLFLVEIASQNGCSGVFSVMSAKDKSTGAPHSSDFFCDGASAWTVTATTTCHRNVLVGSTQLQILLITPRIFGAEHILCSFRFDVWEKGQ